MTISGRNEMKIGIVACETFRRELEFITAEDSDIVN